MRHVVDERAAKLDSEPSESEAADNLEGTQEVELMWTEEQELFAVRKDSSVPRQCVPSGLSLCSLSRGPHCRCVALGKTLD